MLVHEVNRPGVNMKIRFMLLFSIVMPFSFLHATESDRPLDENRNSRFAEQAPPASGSQAAQSPSATSDGKDCATLHRLYMESQACFSRYRNANGSIKAEAFDNCTPVIDPNPVCGPYKPD